MFLGLSLNFWAGVYHIVIVIAFILLMYVTFSKDDRTKK